MTRSSLLPLVTLLLFVPAAGAFAQLVVPPPQPRIQLKTGPQAPEQGGAPARGVPAIVQLRDGSQIAGDVVSSTPGFIVIRTPGGVIRAVPRTEIARIDAARRARAAKATRAIGQRVASDLHEPPRRGETRFGIFPLVQTGVTDHFAVGVTPLILPNGRAAIFVMGQLQVQQPNGIGYSAGFLHSEWFDHGRFGVAFGNVTKRTERSSMTAGAFLPYAQTTSGGGSILMLRLGGGHTIGRSGFRVSADAFASRQAGVITTTLGRAANNVAWSAGVMTVVRDGNVIRVVPILNLGVRF